VKLLWHQRACPHVADPGQRACDVSFRFKRLFTPAAGFSSCLSGHELCPSIDQACSNSPRERCRSSFRPPSHPAKNQRSSEAVEGEEFPEGDKQAILLTVSLLLHSPAWERLGTALWLVAMASDRAERAEKPRPVCLPVRLPLGKDNMSETVAFWAAHLRAESSPPCLGAPARSLRARHGAAAPSHCARCRRGTRGRSRRGCGSPVCQSF